MPKDSTAEELASALDDMHHFPHHTAGLSMLDEATIAYGALTPELLAAQLAFAQACYKHQRSYRSEVGGYSDEDWAAALAAAGRLATALRELGDFRIERCTRQAGWETCNLPLDPDGACPLPSGHQDSTKGGD